MHNAPSQELWSGDTWHSTPNVRIYEYSPTVRPSGADMSQDYVLISTEMDRSFSCSSQSDAATANSMCLQDQMDDDAVTSRCPSFADRSVIHLGWPLDTADTSLDSVHMGYLHSHDHGNVHQVPRNIPADAFEPDEYLLMANLVAEPSVPANYNWHASAADAIPSPNMLSETLLTDGFSSPSSSSSSGSLSSAVIMSRDCSIASYGSGTTYSSMPTSAIDMLRLHSNVSSGATSSSSFGCEIPLPNGGISHRSPYFPPLSCAVSSFAAEDGVDTESSTASSSNLVSPLNLHVSRGSDMSSRHHRVSPRKSSSTSVCKAPDDSSTFNRSTSTRNNTGTTNSLSQSPSSSTTTRPSRRRHEQVEHSLKRPIRPKALHLETVVPDSKDPHIVRIHSSDGTSKTVGVLPPSAPSSSGHRGPGYSRPQNPKLLCPYCQNHPEGFRGEHELQRHTSRAHAPVRKAWICIDASEDGQFLAQCKACVGEKKYGAYYNAAAQAHFNPRKRGRKAKTDAEKRGGKGGGNWPAMDVLKERWMREVEEIVDDLPGAAAAAKSNDANDAASVIMEDDDVDEESDDEEDDSVAAVDDVLAAIKAEMDPESMMLRFGSGDMTASSSSYVDPAQATFGSWQDDVDPEFASAMMYDYNDSSFYGLADNGYWTGIER